MFGGEIYKLYSHAELSKTIRLLISNGLQKEDSERAREIPLNKYIFKKMWEPNVNQ